MGTSGPPATHKASNMQPQQRGFTLSVRASQTESERPAAVAAGGEGSLAEAALTR